MPVPYPDNLLFFGSSRRVPSSSSTELDPTLTCQALFDVYQRGQEGAEVKVCGIGPASKRRKRCRFCIDMVCRANQEKNVAKSASAMDARQQHSAHEHRQSIGRLSPLSAQSHPLLFQCCHGSRSKVLIDALQNVKAQAPPGEPSASCRLFIGENEEQFRRWLDATLEEDSPISDFKDSVAFFLGELCKLWGKTLQDNDDERNMLLAYFCAVFGFRCPKGWLDDWKAYV